MVSIDFQLFHFFNQNHLWYIVCW